MNLLEIATGMSAPNWKIIHAIDQDALAIGQSVYPENDGNTYPAVCLVSPVVNIKKTDIANAEAIVMSVNNTFGKGLNPEQFEQLWQLANALRIKWYSKEGIQKADIEAMEQQLRLSRLPK